MGFVHSSLEFETAGSPFKSWMFAKRRLFGMELDLMAEEEEYAIAERCFY